MQPIIIFAILARSFILISHQIEVSSGSTAPAQSSSTTSANIQTDSGLSSAKVKTSTMACQSFCVNGLDAGECLQNCSCSVGDLQFFSGSVCETINLTVTFQNTSARTVNISWPYAPLIDQGEYSFVYKNNGTVALDPNSNIIKEDTDVIVSTAPFEMLNDVTARLINLHKTTKYIICIIESGIADTLSHDNDVEALYPGLENCVYVETTDNLVWPYTLAAFIIAGLMIITVIGLIIAKLISDRSIENKDMFFWRKKKGKTTIIDKDVLNTQAIDGEPIPVLYLEDIERSGSDISGVHTSLTDGPQRSTVPTGPYYDTIHPLAKDSSDFEVVNNVSLVLPGSADTEPDQPAPVSGVMTGDQPDLPGGSPPADYLPGQAGNYDPGVTAKYAGLDQSDGRESSHNGRTDMPENDHSPPYLAEPGRRDHTQNYPYHLENPTEQTRHLDAQFPDADY